MWDLRLRRTALRSVAWGVLAGSAIACAQLVGLPNEDGSHGGDAGDDGGSPERDSSSDVDAVSPIDSGAGDSAGDGALDAIGVGDGDSSVSEAGAAGLVGAGFDLVRGETRATCVAFDSVGAPSPVTEAVTSVVHASGEALTALDLSTAQIARLAAGLDEPGVRVIDDHPINASAVWIAVRAKRASELRADNVHVLPAYASLAASHPKDFVAQCGDGVTTRVLTGARLVALVRVATSSPDEAADIEEAVTSQSGDLAKIGEALANKHVAIAMAEAREDADAGIDAGGAGAACTDLTCLAQRVDAILTGPVDWAHAGPVVGRTVTPYPLAEAGVVLPSDAVATEAALVASLQTARDRLVRAQDSLAYPEDYVAYDAGAVGVVETALTNDVARLRAAIASCFGARDACANAAGPDGTALPGRRDVANMIPDPGLEQQTVATPSTRPWLTSALAADALVPEIDVGLGHAHRGQNNGSVTAAVGNKDWGGVGVWDVPVNANTKYVVSGWFRTSNVFAYGQFTVDDLGWQALASVPIGAPLSGGYEYRSFEFNSGPNTAVVVHAGFNPGVATNAEWLWMDDWQMTESHPH